MVSAFASGRQALLLHGSRDLVHQPYRERACPLLPALAGLAGWGGVCSVTLSGAGPSVLLVLESGADEAAARAAVKEAGGDLVAEVVFAKIAGGAVCDGSNVTKVL
jgi:homoserine kinase